MPDPKMVSAFTIPLAILGAAYILAGGVEKVGSGIENGLKAVGSGIEKGLSYVFSYLS